MSVVQMDQMTEIQGLAWLYKEWHFQDFKIKQEAAKKAYRTYCTR
jgi:hypothetical protein